MWKTGVSSLLSSLWWLGLQGVHNRARCDQIVPPVQDEGAVQRRRGGRWTSWTAPQTSSPAATLTKAPSPPCSSLQPPNTRRSSPLHSQQPQHQPLVQPAHTEVRALDVDMRRPVCGAGRPLHGHLPHGQVHHHLPPLLPDHPNLRPCHRGKIQHLHLFFSAFIKSEVILSIGCSDGEIRSNAVGLREPSFTFPTKVFHQASPPPLHYYVNLFQNKIFLSQFSLME